MTTRSGNVVAARFGNEEVTVLFVPDTGEVIRCSNLDWDKLIQDKSDHPSELAITLSNLGVLIT